MTRRLLNLLTAASLVLCVTMAVLWARTFGGSDYLTRETGFRADGLVVTSAADTLQWTPGGIHLRRRLDTNPQRDAAGVAYWVRGVKTQWHLGRLSPSRYLQWYEAPTPRSFWNRLGFYHLDATVGWSGRTERTRAWIVPAWLPVLAFAMPPALWLIAASRHRRRRKSGLCPACGYNLTGNVSGVCPECGAASKPAETTPGPTSSTSPSLPSPRG